MKRRQDSKKDRTRFYRSRRHKVLGGVCGGLADYFDIDPILIRLLFILLLLAEGMGFLVYIIAWIIIPLEPLPVDGRQQNFYREEDRSCTGQDRRSGRADGFFSSRERYLGIFLVLLGALFLFNMWFPAFYLRPFWPLILIFLGLLLLVRGVDFGG
ncbi:PspC domain-containing protein [Halarsenatibacter silvermanii]|uniref:Phage shock protein PspC (Stress-responsive transcriptional regulator) n=1 Tax=Halarsenatibacter silvermanii TaxID=321763 RepID=A0A1G9QFT5_9FIRM|nr:PspC domain-containing protein [Halarsenatibacter silvermanii]SDM09357.1 Phage shock protein PspC (stress-responsive transcriptional regulator) [Halarsenatibacter silvermanii]